MTEQPVAVEESIFCVCGPCQATRLFGDGETVEELMRRAIREPLYLTKLRVRVKYGCLLVQPDRMAAIEASAQPLSQETKTRIAQRIMAIMRTLAEDPEKFRRAMQWHPADQSAN